MMKKTGSIARALLTMTLAAAALAACGNGDRNNGYDTGYNNGYGGDVGINALPNSCGTPIPGAAFGSGYGNYGYHQIRVQIKSAATQEQASNDSTAFVGQPGYGGGYGYGGYGGGNFANGIQGCGGGEIPVCDVRAGAGLTCLPSNGLPLNHLAGWQYGNQGGFGYGGAGLTPCQGGGFGGGSCYNQIAQTCVPGMPNGCLQGACIPAPGGNGIGVCAIQ